MRPVAGRLMPGVIHKALVLRAGDRTDAQLEWIDEDAMRRPFVPLAELCTHGEPAARDRCERSKARVVHRTIIMPDSDGDYRGPGRHGDCFGYPRRACNRGVMRNCVRVLAMLAMSIFLSAPSADAQGYIAPSLGVVFGNPSAQG